MGSARAITAADLIAQIDYDLRNSTSKTQYATAELFVYLNRCLELVYQVLLDSESELILTGTGTITLSAGTSVYSLTSNSMGDLWVPYRVWISEYDPMEEGEEEDRYPYLRLEDEGDTSSRTRPTSFYLEGDNIGFLPYSDDTYTANLKYYPNFVPLSASTENMPFKNLFNMQVAEGVKLFAKNRNNDALSVEASLMEVFQQRALQIMWRRTKQNYRAEPRFN